MEKQSSNASIFSKIKLIIVISAIMLVVVGTFYTDLNINIIFLLASIIFLVSVLESYYLNSKDNNLFIDWTLALSFFYAYFII